MATWQEGDVAHTRKAGVFELCVWPLSGDGPFQAWVNIPADGDSTILPRVKGLPTVEEAKKVVELQFEVFLRITLDALVND